LASAVLLQIEVAEGHAASGHPDRARELLTSLVGVVGSKREAGPILRCLDLAKRIGAFDLALHYALCLWHAGSGRARAKQAVGGAALFHPDRRVAGAGYRICLERARAIDWHVVVEADPYATWSEIRGVCGTGPSGARTVSQLRNAHRMRAIGSAGTGSWALGPARVTRAGRSVAIGAHDSTSGDACAYVPALSVWDPSAALRWTMPPTERYDRLGLLATRFGYSGYWHWLIEGLLHAVRLDEAGLLQSADRLVVCLEGEEPGFIAQSLQSIGIPTSMVQVSVTPFDYRTNELVVPMRAAGFGGLIDETGPSELREIIAQNAQHDPRPDIRATRRRLGLDSRAVTRPSRRLLVSRRDAATRRVTNEDALLSALAPLGFELIVPGALTFDEQVEAFALAEIVVGPHGAGLANTLFMPRGSAVLELHHVAFRRPWYRRLAETLGLHYRSLACDADDYSHRNMVVAVDEATTLVRDLLRS
jgi:Glycosyltransferase 61